MNLKKLMFTHLVLGWIFDVERTSSNIHQFASVAHISCSLAQADMSHRHNQKYSHDSWGSTVTDSDDENGHIQRRLDKVVPPLQCIENTLI